MTRTRSHSIGAGGLRPPVPAALGGDGAVDRPWLHVKPERWCNTGPALAPRAVSPSASRQVSMVADRASAHSRVKSSSRWVLVAGAMVEA